MSGRAFKTRSRIVSRIPFPPPIPLSYNTAMRHRRPSPPWDSLSLAELVLAAFTASTAFPAANTPATTAATERKLDSTPAAVVVLEGPIDNYNRDNFIK